MENPEFCNDPVQVTGTIDDQGQVNLQSLTWRGQRYSIVALGRQWSEEDGRHVMAEAADGTRFELQLSRLELIWYVRRVWEGWMAA
jgi:hypothetical protein